MGCRVLIPAQREELEVHEYKELLRALLHDIKRHRNDVYLRCRSYVSQIDASQFPYAVRRLEAVLNG